MWHISFSVWKLLTCIMIISKGTKSYIKDTVPSGPSGGGLLGKASLNKGGRTWNTWTLQRWVPYFSCTGKEAVVPGSMEQPASLLLWAPKAYSVQVRWPNTALAYLVHPVNYSDIYHLEYGGHIHQILLKTKPPHNSTMKMGPRCYLCSLQLGLPFRCIYDEPASKW